VPDSRRITTKPEIVAGAEGPPPPLRSTSTRAADSQERSEVLEALAMLATLPARKRDFLVAKVAGYTHDEIAAQLAASWLTVNRQLIRARAAVRSQRAGA
jgi:DNA-directed RNA polymerase specialized sigma24 family protein